MPQRWYWRRKKRRLGKGVGGGAPSPNPLVNSIPSGFRHEARSYDPRLFRSPSHEPRYTVFTIHESQSTECMIRRPFKQGWLLIRQPEHAVFSGALASHWGNEEFASPEPRSSLLTAAAEHDTGWEEWEHHLGLNQDGEPLNFSEMEVAQHLGIWRRSVAGMTGKDPYAALLISLHATGLYRGGLEENTPKDRHLVEAFLTEQRNTQDRIRQTLWTDPVYGPSVQETTLMHNSRLLHVWDWISLLLCCGEPEAQVIGAAPGGSVEHRIDLSLQPRNELTLAIKPYPFGESPLECKDKRSIHRAWPVSRQRDHVGSFDARWRGNTDLQGREGELVVRGVIFDFDGLIVDTETPIYTARGKRFIMPTGLNFPRTSGIKSWEPLRPKSIFLRI